VIKIQKTLEFDAWLSHLTIKEQAQIEARLYRIEAYEHFGDCKYLEGTSNSLLELRWKNGWRIYFYREGHSAIKLLLGGKKNDQKEDIKKAKVLLRKYSHYQK
jgi:putative addiction module killer protein